MRFWPIVLICFSALFGGAALAADDDAQACARGGEAALPACGRIIESPTASDADKSNALLKRATALRIKGEADRALADVNEAIRLTPRSATAHFQRGFLLRNARDLDGAIAAYSRAIELSPNDSGSFNNRGSAKYAKGDVEGAAPDFQEAIRLNPKNAIARANRARILIDRNEADAALADLDESIRLEPTSTFALFQRARAFELKRDPDKAIADYSEVLRLEPKNASAFANRGAARLGKGEFDLAHSDLSQALINDPANNLARINRARVALERNDASQALEDLNEALRRDPGSARAFFQRGRLWALKKNFDNAISDYSEAIRLNAKDGASFNNRGNAWKEKGDLERALADFSAAMQLSAKDPLYPVNRAIVWRAKGEHAKAIEDATESIRRDPKYAAAYTQRGLAYERLNDVARARSDYSAALAIPAKADATWAHNTARARLALLSASGQKAATPPPADEKADRKAAVAPTPQQPAAGGDRVALVIGNGRYENAPALPNPPNDATATARALREIGFSVVEGVNLKRSDMDQRIIEFLRRATSARVALLYYAGHAVEIDERNYLVPIDARDISRSTMMFELVEVDRIVAALSDETRANILILDACRDNPLGKRTAGSRSTTRGGGLAAYTSVDSGMLIAFAAAPGKTALDGDGQNSPFTKALLKHIRTPNLEINQMLTRVRIDVAAETERGQIPWVNSSLLGDLQLVRK